MFERNGEQFKCFSKRLHEFVTNLHEGRVSGFQSFKFQDTGVVTG